MRLRAAALCWLLPAAGWAASWDLLWMRTWDGPDHRDEAVEGLACDAAGNVYAAGWTDRSLIGEGVNAVVIKYAPDGTPLWTRTTGGYPGSDEFAFGVAAAADGTLWVAGSVSNTGGACDAWLRHLDSAGQELWATTWVDPGGGQSVFRGVALDRVTGAVYAAGCAQRDDLLQSGNGLLLRYPAGGGVPVVLDNSDTNGFWDEWLAVAAVPGGGVAVAGYVTLDDPPTALLGANVRGRRSALLSASNPNTNIDLAVRKFGAGGSLQWSKSYGSEVAVQIRKDFARGVAVDAAGRVVVAGGVQTDNSSPPNVDRFIRAWSADGVAVLWTRVLAGANPNSDPKDYAVGAAAGGGYVFVGGVTARGNLNQGMNLALDVLDAPSGFVVRQEGYTSGFFLDDAAEAVAVDGAGRVVVGGWENRTDLNQRRNWLVRAYAGVEAAAPAPGEVRAWPNPFEPARAAGGALKFAGLPAGSRVSLFTLAGARVRELPEAGGLAAWDGRNGDGRAAAAGVYYWTVTAGATKVAAGTVALVRRP